MRKIIYLLAIAILTLSSCDVNDPIYDTPHPDKGQITLTADWSGLGASIAKPSGYDISVAGYGCTLAGDCNTLDKIFDPGTYTGLAWNTADKVTVSGSTATVAATDGYVAAQPGWLFTACDNNVLVEKGKHHQYTATMCQQVRELTLVIEPTGGTASTISDISGYLSGVARTLDIDNGTHATPSNVQLVFVKGSDGKYRATVRLLGIAGSEQKLTGTITFTGGTPADQSIDSDMTTALANFNADKKTPLTLDATVVETLTEFGLIAIITSWELGNGSGESGSAE